MAMTNFLPGLMAVVALAVTAPVAQKVDADSPIEAVRALLEAQSRNDQALIEALSAGEMTAIDEASPYFWTGPTGNADWARDFAAALVRGSISAPDPRPIRRLGSTTRGDHAFVTFLVDYRFLRHGAPMSKSGVETFVLVRQGGRWAHLAYAWAGEGAVELDAAGAVAAARAFSQCVTRPCRDQFTAHDLLSIDAIAGTFGRPWTPALADAVPACASADKTRTWQAAVRDRRAYVALVNEDCHEARALVLENTGQDWKVRSEARLPFPPPPSPNNP